MVIQSVVIQSVVIQSVVIQAVVIQAVVRLWIVGQTLVCNYWHNVVTLRLPKTKHGKPTYQPRGRENY